MKKYTTMISALAVILLCLLLLPTRAQAASASALTVKLNEDGESYAVTDCDESATGKMKIPAKYEGKPITVIAPSAFANCTGLTNVVIPQGVIEIKDGAFQYCTALTRVTIPQSVTIIGRDLFYKCPSLTDVYYTGSRKAWRDIEFYDRLVMSPEFYGADRHYGYFDVDVSLPAAIIMTVVSVAVSVTASTLITVKILKKKISVADNSASTDSQ